jgi:hypothetical protein
VHELGGREVPLDVGHVPEVAERRGLARAVAALPLDAQRLLVVRARLVVAAEVVGDGAEVVEGVRFPLAVPDVAADLERALVELLGLLVAAEEVGDDAEVAEGARLPLPVPDLWIASAWSLKERAASWSPVFWSTVPRLFSASASARRSESPRASSREWR